MSEPFNALEAELAALTPRGFSPRLPQRIKERLARASHSWKRRLAWTAVVAGGIAASLMLTVLGPPGKNPPSLPETVGDKPPAPDPSQVARQERLPTAFAYEQALAKSPEAFEALLDYHARTCSVSVGPGQRASLWMSSLPPTGEQ